MQQFDRTKVVFQETLYIFNTEVLKFRSLVNQFISNSTELKLTVRIKKKYIYFEQWKRLGRLYNCGNYENGKMDQDI